MATAHFLMQGKGGVGKSLVASLLFQYLQRKNLIVHGCDTDPINSTFPGHFGDAPRLAAVLSFQHSLHRPGPAGRHQGH